MPTAELRAPLSRLLRRRRRPERPRSGIRRFSEVPGVSEVVVDLAANAVTVHGTDLDDERLRAAIVEAGYGIADSIAA
ncbi:heavy-metal-associated domain-containing protein [Streptomyces sp. NPDC002550]